jgi:cation transport ATPase
MKDSSDIAREVADITLLDSNLMQLAVARLLGQRLMRRIQRNFNYIVGFNTALLALGVGNAISPGVSALLHNMFTIAISAASTRPLLRGDARNGGSSEWG